MFLWVTHKSVHVLGLQKNMLVVNAAHLLTMPSISFTTNECKHAKDNKQCKTSALPFGRKLHRTTLAKCQRKIAIIFLSIRTVPLRRFF